MSRGITELLLTSDNQDGLKLGGVNGGIVAQTHACPRAHAFAHMHTDTCMVVQTHTHIRDSQTNQMGSGSCEAVSQCEAVIQCEAVSQCLVAALQSDP